MWQQIVVIFIIAGCQLCAANDILNEGPCNFLNTVNISTGYLDQHGNLHHDGAVFKKGTFKEYDYVIEDLKTRVKVAPHVRGCICETKPCIRVCCLKDGVGKSCIKSDTFKVPLDSEAQNFLEIDTSNGKYAVLAGKPCANAFLMDKEDKWFYKNGSIESTDGEASLTEYCIGQSVDEEGTITTHAQKCYDVEANTDIRLSLYPIGMIISLPFLLITFCVYAFVPELRNLHGKSLMCYVAALMSLYISLIVVQLESEVFMPEDFICVFFGYLTYISVFLCFFWLNVMCYDIWSTFRGSVRRRGGEQKRFLKYCVYAFSVPVLLSVITFIIDSQESIPEEYRPVIGKFRCWIQDDRFVEAVYLYFPISIILVVNIVLYSITAYKIYSVQKETSVIRNGESQKHSKTDADKDRFFLYLRLFIIMGATWSMEAISWVVNSQVFFYASDVLNCLQGLLIFFLFVWKPKVRQLVRQRYHSTIKRLPLPAPRQNDSSGATTTTSLELSKNITSANKNLAKTADKNSLQRPILAEDA